MEFAGRSLSLRARVGTRVFALTNRDRQGAGFGGVVGLSPFLICTDLQVTAYISE